MIRARDLAGKLELRAQIKISHAARALHLRFSDASALWLSPSGSGLAVEAQADSDAHRFAAAHARQVGWEILSQLQNWPVPRSCNPGDWIAAPTHLLPALRVQILRTAHIERLPESTLDVDSHLSKYPPIPMPRFQIAPQRRFVLFSGACVARSSERLSLQISQLSAFLAETPDLLCLFIRPETDAPAPISPVTLLAVLGKRLEEMAKQPLHQTPVVNDAVDTAKGDGPDDAPGMSM